MLKRLAALGVLAAFPAHAADGYVSFVECPIVRDTATVPCWLSEHKGQMYYLGIQTDISAEFHPPSLGHKVLVEGKLADKADICGGKVIEPVEVSIMPDLDNSCNTILPAEDKYQVPFAPRPPGPSGGRLAFADAPRRQPAAPPQPPYKATEYVINYPFEARNIPGAETRKLTQALNYAKLSGAKKIEVTGYRGAAKLTEGRTIEEAPDIAKYRAHQIAELLQTVGGPDLQIEIAWVDQTEPADGVSDPTRRRTRIVVTP